MEEYPQDEKKKKNKKQSTHTKSKPKHIAGTRYISGVHLVRINHVLETSEAKKMYTSARTPCINPLGLHERFRGPNLLGDSVAQKKKNGQEYNPRFDISTKEPRTGIIPGIHIREPPQKDYIHIRAQNRDYSRVPAKELNIFFSCFLPTSPDKKGIHVRCRKVLQIHTIHTCCATMWAMASSPM